MLYNRLVVLGMIVSFIWFTITVVILGTVYQFIGELNISLVNTQVNAVM